MTVVQLLRHVAVVMEQHADSHICAIEGEEVIRDIVITAACIDNHLGYRIANRAPGNFKYLRTPRSQRFTRHVCSQHTRF